ncbi:1336_t:CDS:1, partial [Racocetra persica]
QVPRTSLPERNRKPEDKSNPPKIEITEELTNKFSSIPNFETREKVEELLNSVKDNEEFLQQHPDLTSKSPKEVVIAAK